MNLNLNLNLMCLFNMVGYTVYKPFPGCIKQLDKTRTCLENTLKKYSSDNPLNVYILKLTIIYTYIKPASFATFMIFGFD